MIMKRIRVSIFFPLSRILSSVAVLLLLTSPSLGNELPLPAVPDSLRTPRDRADYIVRHFWDAISPTDTAALRNATFIEQNFVNFASLFPHASAEAVDEALNARIKASAADSVAMRVLLSVAERYLYEPESPVFNEESYIVILRNVTSSRPFDTLTMSRYDYQLAEALKNRRGSEAADFKMTLPDGNVTTLHSLAAQADRTVVMFFDPWCDHCLDVITRLDTLCGTIPVVAVYFEGDDEGWTKAREVIPQDWIVAYTPGNPVEEGEIYSIRRLPTLYLIDRTGKVLGKDITVEEIAGL